jgi:hypothetical protein
MFVSLNSLFRRALQQSGWRDGINNTVTFGSQIHQYFQDRLGQRGVKFLTFLGLNILIFLYILLIQDNENSLQKKYHVSAFHRNIFESHDNSNNNIDNTTPSIISNTTDSISIYNITSNSTSTNNTTISNNTTTIIDPNNTTNQVTDPASSFWLSILFTLFTWLILIQILKCVRVAAFSYHRQREQLQQLSLLTNNNNRSNNNNNALATRLRLALLQRDFTGDDYEMLQQLDEIGYNNNNNNNHHSHGRGGANMHMINRLPLHIVTAEEVATINNNNNNNNNNDSNTISDKETKQQSSSQSSSSSSSSLLHTDIESGSNTLSTNNHNNITIATNTKANNNNNNNNMRRCNICLGPYEIGDEVRTLLCLHQFHRECVDTWLRSHNNCPICKFTATSSDNDTLL